MPQSPTLLNLKISGLGVDDLRLRFLFQRVGVIGFYCFFQSFLRPWVLGGAVDSGSDGAVGYRLKSGRQQEISNS